MVREEVEVDVQRITIPIDPSLCTDVPPRSGKIGRGNVVSRFFLREGGRLYTGYFDPGQDFSGMKTRLR